MKLAIKPRLGSSSSQIDIDSISDGILTLPGNKHCLILSTTSINFELKSEEEQDALIDTYESFLNSIGFAIQFLIRTREIDMASYLEDLESKIVKEEMPIYKQQLQSYRHFISTLIESNRILSRQFFVIIPYSSTSKTDTSIYKDQLKLRADIVAKNLSRLGIACQELSSLEIIDLFYSFYSPEQAKIQPISDQAIKVMDHDFIRRKTLK